jgi:hypothetical protein
MSIILNENIQSNSPKSLDNKYLKDGVTPYADVAEVNSIIPLTYRSIGLKVNIANVDYWYKDGLQDVDLIPFVSGSITIQQDGVDLPQQPKLNVKSLSLKATDNNPNTATDLEFTGEVCSLTLHKDVVLGTMVDFIQLDGATNVDVITNDLQIRRDNVEGSNQWLFNPLSESNGTLTSPTNSSWFHYTGNPDDLLNIQNLSYKTFYDAVTSSIGSFSNLPSTTWFMKDDQNQYWAIFFVSWSPDSQPASQSFNYLNWSGNEIPDGTIVTIGTRTYTYNLTNNEWTNLETNSYTNLEDCINNDTLSEVNASLGLNTFGSILVTAKIAGVSGNSITTTVVPNIELAFFTPTLTGGSDAIIGGGVNYQRIQIIILCDGSIHFPDGTTQTTAPSIIQNEGVSLPPRPLVDYIGTGVDVTDDAINNKTIVNILGNYKRIINVDIYYGDNTKASLDPYNQSLSFSTLESASAIAQVGDLIVVHPTNVNSNIYYQPNGVIAKDGVDWYFHAGALVLGSGTFNTSGQTVNYNIYGFGEFVSTGFAVPFWFITNQSIVNITCSRFQHSAPFYGCIYADGVGTRVTIVAYNEIDCSQNLANVVFAQNGAYININSPIVKFSWCAYCCTIGDGASIIVNVPKTINYGAVGDPTQFASSYCLMANGGNNMQIKVYGDFYDARAILEPMSDSYRVSGALNMRAIGVNNEIHIIGNKSITNGFRAVRCDSPNNKIFVNTDLQELRGDCVQVEQGTIYLNRRLTAGVTPVGESVGSVADNYLINILGYSAYYNPNNPYQAGFQTLFNVTITNTNTGASTLNINSLGALPILNPDFSDLTAGQLTAGQTYTFMCEGSSFTFYGVTYNSQPIKYISANGLPVLNGAVLISNLGANSIDGSSTGVAVNYANYQGVANKPTLSATEIIGNPLIVSPLVQ